jgi:hypothetical protein
MAKPPVKPPKPPNKPPNKPPVKPPPTTDQILFEILATDKEILKATSQGVTVAEEQLTAAATGLLVARDQLVAARAQLDITHDLKAIAQTELQIVTKVLEIEAQQLAVATQTLEIEKQHLAVAKAQFLATSEGNDILRGILESINEITPPPPHRFTVRVQKAKPPMAVEAGKGAGFTAQMEDNANPIELPAGSTFSWKTDDDTDTIVPVSADNSDLVIVTTTDPPAEGRTSLTVTASAVDPDGDTIEGELTTDIISGVGHTFTISVNQVQINPLRKKR